MQRLDNSKLQKKPVFLMYTCHLSLCLLMNMSYSQALVLVVQVSSSQAPKIQKKTWSSPLPRIWVPELWELFGTLWISFRLYPSQKVIESNLESINTYHILFFPPICEDNRGHPVQHKPLKSIASHGQSDSQKLGSFASGTSVKTSEKTSVKSVLQLCKLNFHGWAVLLYYFYVKTHVVSEALEKALHRMRASPGRINASPGTKRSKLDPLRQRLAPDSDVTMGPPKVFNLKD